MVECSICLDQLKSPVATPCGHLACSDCLKCYIRSSSDAMSATCPTCRKLFNIVAPDLAYVPSKYHTFMLPPMRRIYFDDRSSAATAEAALKAQVTSLEDELKQAKERVTTLAAKHTSLSSKIAKMIETASSKELLLHRKLVEITSLKGTIDQLHLEKATLERKTKTRLDSLTRFADQQKKRAADLMDQLGEMEEGHQRAIEERDRELARLRAVIDPATRPSILIPGLGIKRKGLFSTTDRPSASRGQLARCGSTSSMMSVDDDGSEDSQNEGVDTDDHMEELPTRLAKRHKSVGSNAPNWGGLFSKSSTFPAPSTQLKNANQHVHSLGLASSELGSPFKTPQRPILQCNASHTPNHTPASNPLEPKLESDASTVLDGHGLAESLRRATREAGSRTPSSSSLAFGGARVGGNSSPSASPFARYNAQNTGSPFQFRFPQGLGQERTHS